VEDVEEEEERLCSCLKVVLRGIDGGENHL
jgi:hypothetical protein